MKRVGKVVVLDSISGVTPTAKVDSELKEYLANLTPEMEPENLSDLPVLDLPEAMQERLMAHQKIGVRWLHSLFLSGSGGILGDDMGLGKTYQVICLLAGLMKRELVNRILILAPVSVLPSWQRELMEHLKPHVPGLEVFLTNSDLTKKKRLQILDSTFQKSMRGYTPKIVISSYHLVSNMVDDFANRGRWDYVILDEGHVIKNPTTKISKSMHLLSSNHRLILTGTPIQNNLNEFWAIVNWATKGKRFGTLSGFKEDYTLPIVLGQDPKASAEQRRIADEAAKNLLALIKPIILQRKKCELPSNAQLNLPTKIELVVWSPLATSQRELYEQFIHSRQFSTAVNRSNCPVEVINHLKTVCRHPLLIEALEMNRRRRDQATAGVPASNAARAAQSPRPAQVRSSQHSQDNEGGDDMEFLSHGLADMSMAQDGTGEEEGELEEVLKSLPTHASVFDVVDREPDVKELLRGSIKLRILLKLVHRLHYAGHRTLVFSQSRLMLDIIQRVFVEYGLASYRIDGSVRSSERQRIIDEYNDNSEDSLGPSICLLTTKACGFGITLTGADRVIIYDPSWNPAEDRQAVDRAYRIGQTKPVVVYRLIMASSVEEKMYEKQVFKDGIRVVTESGTSSRYFSRDETTELFKLGPVNQSVVMERLWSAAGGQSLREFPDTRGELPSVLGFTRHDTLYTEARPDAASQGSDAYSQYIDRNHVPSDDDEEDYVGVPPTPAPKRRTKAAPVSAIKKRLGEIVPGKENILDGLNKMRNLADIAAQKNGKPEAMELSCSPEPKGFKSNRYSTAFDLSSPTPSVPVRDPKDRFSMMSQMSDLTCDTSLQTQEEFESDFQQLSSSKLYREEAPLCEEPVEPLIELVDDERVGTPLCSDSEDESSNAVEERSRSDEEQESVKEEHASVWSQVDIAAFNALKEQKLFTPPASPNKHEVDMHYRVASPPMSQFETQQDFEQVSYDERGGCTQSVRSMEYETASEATSEAATIASSVHEMSLPPEKSSAEYEEYDQLDPIDRLLQSVLPPSAAEVNAREEQEQVNQSHEEGLDPDSEDLASAATAFLAEFAAELGTSAEDTCDRTVVSAEDEEKEEDEVKVLDSEELGEDMCDLRRPSTPVLNSECSSQAGEEDWPADDATIVVENAQERIDDLQRPSTPILDSDCSSQVSCRDLPVDDVTVVSDDETLQELESELPFDEEVDGAEAYSDEDEEHEHLEFPGPQAASFAGRESVKPRMGGGYLLNLCEMGSMKRTSSMHSNNSATVASTVSQSTGDDLLAQVNSQDNVTPVSDPSAASFSSPKLSDSQEGAARLGSGAVTTRKPKKSPVFSHYMEPDLFASPLFSPSFAARRTSEATCSTAVSASGGTEVGPAASPVASSQPLTTFHDPLQDLVDQVQSLNIANPAAAATPMSKISFQTTGGQYSNMIIKAQSVSRVQRSFAQLSDSDSESDEECIAKCTPVIQSAGLSSPSTGTVDRLTPPPTNQFLSVMLNQAHSPAATSEEKGTPIAPASGGTLCSDGDDLSLPSITNASPVSSRNSTDAHVPFPRTTLFQSPQRRRSSMWRRMSTGTMVSVGEDSISTAASATSSDNEAGNESEEERHEQIKSLEYQSPMIQDFEETETVQDDAIEDSSPVLSQSSPQPADSLRYDLFRDMVVPPLMMDHNCVIDSNRAVLRTLGLAKVDFPVLHPHYALSADDIDIYNDFLIEGHKNESAEDFVTAAVAYEQALKLCDEVFALHGKLAWLLQKLDN